MRFYLRKGRQIPQRQYLFTAKDVKFTVERLKKSVDFKGLFEPFDEA
jgi:peptide/nickel transport system substrate-binding protein